MKTGINYDDFFLLHDDPNHPECANRLRSIHQRLKDTELLEQLTVFQPPVSDIETIALAHPLSYIETIKSLSQKQGELAAHITGDTYINKYTYEAALRGVGGLTSLCDKVMNGEIKNGFNFSRPPGHHATQNEFMGFCFFSTAAIGALYLLSKYKLGKVAIIDFDVHHGNGTEDVCKDNPNTLFISTHQKNIYPMTANTVRVNTGKGGDNLINCPLPAFTQDAEFLRLADEVIVPALKNFAPEFVIVSAGYDAHVNDPLAELSLTAAGFGNISQKLIQFAQEHCGGKILFNLEGGYDLAGLAHSVENSVRALLGETEFENHDKIPGMGTVPNLDILIQLLHKTHKTRLG